MQLNKSKSLSFSEGYTLVTSQLCLLTMHPGSNLTIWNSLLDANAKCKVWTHDLLVSTEQPYQLSYNCLGCVFVCLTHALWM